ncbi:MAG: helix-turn-helix transcriptional regulator [Spirochaetaceae bacterium]|jgi:predicted transcriptional regulator YheO|nr:helix-turn-helix transcriptional regulator [Spirochaetaceae bacterium]
MESVADEKKFLESLAKGIAYIFGTNCEVVIHDLKGQPYEHSIVAIENGGVTGREVGDCGTNLGLEVIRGTDANGDKYGYLTRTKDGKILRSSSVYIRDALHQVVGAVCINFDATLLLHAEEAIKSLTGDRRNPSALQEHEIEETFPKNVNELLETLLRQSADYVGKPAALMTKEDKLKGLTFLDEKGALLIKKSGDRIARFYGISKYTLYAYLDEIRDTPFSNENF